MINPRNPIQPTHEVNGVLRFKENAIVRHLLDFAQSKGFGLNEIASMDFTDDDRMQLAQLIGYSLSGYGDLSYVDDDSFNAADEMARNGATEVEARLSTVTDELNALRAALAAPMARLFGLHPDDLTER